MLMLSVWCLAMSMLCINFKSLAVLICFVILVLSKIRGSYTGLHRAIKGCTQFWTAIHSYTELCRSIQSYTQCGRAIHNYTELCRSTQSYTGLCRTIQSYLDGWKYPTVFWTFWCYLGALPSNYKPHNTLAQSSSKSHMGICNKPKIISPSCQELYPGTSGPL